MRFGCYEILEPIGKGGAGTVFRARAPDGRVVALKLLGRVHPDTLGRFDRERRILDELGRGEGFVPLLDVGRAPEGPFIVMPFLDGGTLRERLRNGPLPVDAVVGLGVALAQALGRAHARGIVHRDVKPENVLFTGDGRPLVADLGLAKHFRRDAPGAGASRSVSATGAFLGTVGYLPPEQVNDARTAGPPADVFALAALLFECLAGRPPFDGGTVYDTLVRTMDGGGPDFRGLAPATPPWLRLALTRALDPSPERRYRDGAAFAAALEAGPPTVRSRRSLAAALAGLAGLTATVGLALGGHPEVPNAAPVASSSLARPTPAPEASPTTSAALASLAWSLLRRGDDSGAAATASSALVLDPGSVDAHLARGWGRLERDARGAADDFTLALAREPSRTEARFGRFVATTWLGSPDPGDALAAMAATPDFPAAIEGRARILLSIGQHALGLASAEGVLALRPTRPRALAVRAFASAKVLPKGAALEAFGRAISVTPDDAELHFGRGAVLDDLGLLDVALIDFVRAAALAPRRAAVWARLARTRGKLGDPLGALDVDAAAIALDPSDAGPRGERGAHLLALERLPEALADLTAAIELGDAKWTAFRNRALLRERLGDLIGARADLDEAMRLTKSGSKERKKVQSELDRLRRAR